MNKIISKELLSEVFCCIDIHKSKIEGNTLEYYDIYENFERLDLRSLIFDFIMFANSRGFTIYSYFSDIDNGWLLNIEDNYNVTEISDELEQSIYDDGLTPIIIACQWIYDNKNYKKGKGDE